MQVFLFYFTCTAGFTGACLCKHTVYWRVAAIALCKTETTKSPSINVEFC